MYAPLYFSGFFRASGEVAARTGVPAPCVGSIIVIRLSEINTGCKKEGKRLAVLTVFSEVQVDVSRMGKRV